MFFVAGAMALASVGTVASAQTVQYPISAPVTIVADLPRYPVPSPEVTRPSTTVVVAAAGPAVAPAAVVAAPNAVVVVAPTAQVLGNTAVRDLPFTGSSSTQPLVAAGSALLLTGAAFVAVSRRRRRS